MKTLLMTFSDLLLPKSPPFYTLSVAFRVVVAGEGRNSNLATRLIVTSPSIRMTNHPQRGRGSAHINHFTCTTVDFEKFRHGRPTLLSAVNKASSLKLELCSPVWWVASSCRTVTAVWKSYAACHAHFS